MKIVRSLPENDSIQRVLDIGCATGLLGLSVIGDAPERTGVLLVVSEGIQRDLTGPWDMMMGYLPYYFQGMDMGVLRNEVVDTAKKVGFTRFEKRTELLCSGTQDIDIIRK